MSLSKSVNMNRISNNIFADANLESMDIPTKLLPNPYYDFPYLVIENFLSKNICKAISNEIISLNNAKKAKVKSSFINGVIQPSVIEKYRKTNIYHLKDELSKHYEKSFKKYQSLIEEYFHMSLNLSTQLQVLEYKKGSFYVKHADDSNELRDKNGQTIGFTVTSPQRKLTTVLFATSHEEMVTNNYSFSGGELLFNYLYDENGNNPTFKPQAGTMIVFPSNPYFSHEVKPVLDGLRLTLVQWHNCL